MLLLPSDINIDIIILLSVLNWPPHLPVFIQQITLCFPLPFHRIDRRLATIDKSELQIIKTKVVAAGKSIAFRFALLLGPSHVLFLLSTTGNRLEINPTDPHNIPMNVYLSSAVSSRRHHHAPLCYPISSVQCSAGADDFIRLFYDPASQQYNEEEEVTGLTLPRRDISELSCDEDMLLHCYSVTKPCTQLMRWSRGRKRQRRRRFNAYDPL